MKPGHAHAAAGQDLLPGRIGRRITLFSLTLTLLAAAVLSVFTHALIEARLMPELDRQSSTLAEFAATDIERVLRYGVPLRELRGVEAYFDEVRAPHPEIDFIALIDPGGVLLHFSGKGEVAAARDLIRAAMSGAGSSGAAIGLDPHPARDSLVLAPVGQADNVTALVAVGTDVHFTERQLRELALDVIVILIVAMFLSFEISNAILSNLVTRPLSELNAVFRRVASGNLGAGMDIGARDAFGEAVAQANRVLRGLHARYNRLRSRAGQAAGLEQRLGAYDERFRLAGDPARRGAGLASPAQVRLALFVLVGADEMQKAFLPLYVEELQIGALGWLSPEVMVGLPISIYMLALALCTPFAGTWTDRLGARRVFLYGLVPAFFGFVGSAFATSVLELVASRALSAIGYALCTIAAQGFILARMPRAERAQGASIFIGVIMAANICGTAIGGLLADLISYRAVFLCAAALSILAALLAWKMLPGNDLLPGAPKRGLRWSDMRMMLKNGRFMALLLLSAIPAKIVLTGFLFYAVPISLSGLGASESEIARAMILYSLVIILSGPWLSRLASTARRSWLLVAGGTLLSGLAVILLLYEQSIAMIVASVLLIGIAHAMSISPQIALVPEICRRESESIGETGVLGIFRMLERVGSVAGPVLVAALVMRFGLYEGLAWTGAGVITMGLLLVVLAAILAREAEEGQ